MHLSSTFTLPLLPLLPGLAAAAKVPKNAILLSDVQSLTLRGAGAKTTHRRVSAAPQLKCVSSKEICDLYDIDVMRCTNQGAGYSSEDIQWSCTASLPEELKLGSTDVICEGYSSAEDPYILRGSCGVEYRLALTDKGERRYPNIGKGGGGSRGDGETDWGAYLFGILFFGVIAWMVYSACVAGAQNRAAGNTGRRRGGGGGGGGGGPGGGGGGGGGWDPGFGQDNNDPPPPYPGTKPSNQGAQQGWRPGFWTGAGAGGAAGYGAGYYQGRNSNRNQRGYGTDDNGSSWGAGPSRSSTSSSSSSARHESTGFGSTNRR
ncbi:hypothetical protein EsH8_IV_001025 [Colletotrichum jinshuiense]